MVLVYISQTHSFVVSILHVTYILLMFWKCMWLAPRRVPLLLLYIAFGQHITKSWYLAFSVFALHVGQTLWESCLCCFTMHFVCTIVLLFVHRERFTYSESFPVYLYVDTLENIITEIYKRKKELDPKYMSELITDRPS